MLPNLSLLNKRRSQSDGSENANTGLVVVLQDPMQHLCTMHSVYVITDKFTSRIDGFWGFRLDYLKKSFSNEVYEPINFIKPYIITDSALKEEVGHLNAYGQYLFSCGSRSTHMTYSYRGGLGCAMAHLRVWNSIVNCSRDFCLVVEDNVYFGEGTSGALSFYEAKFKELDADYLMLHTLGPFEDYCKEDEQKRTLSEDMEYIVNYKGETTPVREKLYSLDRPMMSTKCYFISKRFATRMHDMLYDLYETNQMPAMHVDALMSLEALKQGYRAFYREPHGQPLSEQEASIFDNVDHNRSFIGVLKKLEGQGIQHNVPVASRNSEPAR